MSFLSANPHTGEDEAPTTDIPSNPDDRLQDRVDGPDARPHKETICKGHTDTEIGGGEFLEKLSSLKNLFVFVSE